MQVLKQFSLPIKGLKIGTHDYRFDIDKGFFSAHDHSPYKNGDIEGKLQLEKKTDHLILNVEFKGTLELECDRCTDIIDYPTQGASEILVKYSEDEREEEEVIYIHPESPEFNCSKVFFDAILLGMPLHKTCDDLEEKDCDPEILKILNAEVEEDPQKETALSQALKDIDITKN